MFRRVPFSGRHRGLEVTDYAKHIAALEDEYAIGRLNGGKLDAIKAAIGLMQAAQPKDAVAERKHCEQAFDSFHGYAPDLLVRERAAARAEWYAGRVNTLAARIGKDFAVRDLATQLVESDLQRHLLETKLKERDAEIEWLRDELAAQAAFMASPAGEASK
jgi:hypothetical protein